MNKAIQDRRQFLAFALSAFVAALVSCSTRKTAGEDLAEEVGDLQSKTLPADARMVSRSELVRDGWSGTASWEIETKLSPSDYSKLIVTHLSDFKVLKESDSELVLSKLKGNDTHVIECKFTQMNQEFLVKVAFSARPD